MFDSLIVVFLRDRLKKTHDRLCRLICGKRLFNSDMSREIDRLLVENDRLRELLKRHGGES